MRKNLSEELKINDDVTLNDGEEKKPEEVKEGDKLEKDIQKEIDEKNKIADEVRDAEAPELEAKDGHGKALKIKQFTEKLILEEPSNSLNENLYDLSDKELTIYNEQRQEALQAMYDAIGNFAFYLEDYFHLSDDEVQDELESIFDEALMKFNEGE